MKQLDSAHIISTIVSLFGDDSTPKVIDVDMVFNPNPTSTDGGANGGIYVANGKEVPIDEDIMVIFHEFSHVASKFWP